MSHTYGGPTWNKNTFTLSANGRSETDYERKIIRIHEKLNLIIEELKWMRKRLECEMYFRCQADHGRDYDCQE